MWKGILLMMAVSIGAGCKQSADKATATTPQKEVLGEADLGSLYQYYHAEPSTLEQRDENLLIEYAASRNMQVTRTQSGVYMQILRKGSGGAVKWGDPIATHYRGMFLDGKQFDSSIDRGKPLAFRVGQMIPGWNEALITRNIGDKFVLLIPSHMAYGKRGFPGAVPPDANLIFEVEILYDTAQ